MGTKIALENAFSCLRTAAAAECLGDREVADAWRDRAAVWFRVAAVAGR